MGEFAGWRTPDYSGPPLLPAQFLTVGTARCIERGGGDATAPLTTDFANAGAFLPSGCYHIPERSASLDAFTCPYVAWHAFIMKLVYDGNWEDYLVHTIGAGATTRSVRREDDSLYSHFGIAIRGDDCHVYIDGTRNQGQLLTQAYYGYFGPVHHGVYDANTLYHENANRVLREVTRLGGDACKRFILVGHSYGGATAAVAAAILQLNKPDAEIAILTFGAPRAGGRQLQAALRAIPQRHFRRPPDPVPLLPPQYAVGTDLFAAAFNGLAIASWLAWGRYVDYDNQLLLQPDGSWGGLNNDPPSADLLWTLVTLIKDGTDLPPFVGHAMSSYATDMALHCGVEFDT